MKSFISPHKVCIVGASVDSDACTEKQGQWSYGVRMLGFSLTSEVGAQAESDSKESSEGQVTNARRMDNGSRAR